MKSFAPCLCQQIWKVGEIEDFGLEGDLMGWVWVWVMGYAKGLFREDILILKRIWVRGFRIREGEIEEVF